ncbi:cdc42 effector protein 2 [Tachysurus fulvidraco]|uniref:cdc42 effector protein 2 n=1 Tax=Tachysurus fulvidraco TaxID=1234273 RepID=UPI000F4EEB18|nr:cdc42 effector protein 2 [Tachysurus fulvidraco]
MPAKTPMYLKTPTPKNGKKLKLRDVLSSDMISPPLGDLRHSAHVGPEGEGDMFGDVGFLQGKMDMLPALAHPSSNSINRHVDDMFAIQGLQRRYNSHHKPNDSSILKSTFSMPAFIAPEQPPPKPPRLHLEESSNQQKNHHNQQQHSMSVCAEGVEHYREPYRDFNLSASIPILRQLMPSAGSFSEASSDDSMSEGCVPPDPKRGLSLDSDAGLSNEDLRSEHSESPAFSPTMSRSESLAGLDLDLGPSILDDVLRIMDRYKSVKDSCEL